MSARRIYRKNDAGPLAGLASVLARRAPPYLRHVQSTASSLPVVLRAARATPWRNVRWVRAILAEARVYDVSFALVGSGGRDFCLPVPLEKATGLHAMGMKLEYRYIVRIGVRRHGNSVEYEFGQLRGTDLAAVRSWIRSALVRRPLRSARVIGSVAPAPEVSFGQVVGVLQVLRDEAVDWLDLGVPLVPSARDRSSDVLPAITQGEVTPRTSTTGAWGELAMYGDALHVNDDDRRQEIDRVRIVPEDD